MMEETVTQTSGKYDHAQSRELLLESAVSVVSRPFSGVKIPSRDLQKIKKRKRIMDVAFSIIAVVVLLPFLPLVALGIKLSSSGPVFFTQKRDGKDGKPFVCYKFRTMSVESEDQKKNGEPNVTKKTDHRVFAFGRLLRETNLDELPQLYNVLKGEMSLVGPRPYMVVECNYWKETLDHFEWREEIKPGLSGLAQVNGYRGGSMDIDHMKTRLHYDLLYIKSCNVWIDLMIIWKTVVQMLRFNTNAH